MSKYYTFFITLLISVSFLQSATIPKKGGNNKQTNVNTDALFQFPEVKSEAIDAVFKDTQPFKSIEASTTATEIKNEENPEKEIKIRKFFEDKYEKEEEKEKDEHYDEKYKEKEEEKHEYYEEKYKENKDKHDEDKYEEKDDHYEQKYNEKHEKKDKHKYGEECEDKDEHDEHDEYDSDEEVEDICYHGKCVPHKLCHKEVHGFWFCEHDSHVCCEYKDIKI